MTKLTSTQCQLPAEVSSPYVFVSIFIEVFDTFLDVISKFRFNLPANREELINQLEHDDDSDLVVPRRKNECIEIGSLK